VSHGARILLVDDEPSIQRSVAQLLRSRGYDVDVAGTGGDALRHVTQYRPDLIVLDLGLPDISGVEVCQHIRVESETVPIVVLSAHRSEADKVNALELGADDYVTKPFGPDELVARIKVALRRVRLAAAPPQHQVIGDLSIDHDRHHVIRAGETIRLTPMEFRLLAFFARNAGRVLTHRAILRAVWGPQAVDEREHLWVLVRQLRKKIEPDPTRPRYLLVEPWVGYRFTGEPSD
jgi:two-component system, OmpR family, KDP operon response regulator KdpE